MYITILLKPIKPKLKNLFIFHFRYNIIPVSSILQCFINHTLKFLIRNHIIFQRLSRLLNTSNRRHPRNFLSLIAKLSTQSVIPPHSIMIINNLSFQVLPNIISFYLIRNGGFSLNNLFRSIYRLFSSSFYLHRLMKLIFCLIPHKPFQSNSVSFPNQQFPQTPLQEYQIGKPSPHKPHKFILLHILLNKIHNNPSMESSSIL